MRKHLTKFLIILTITGFAIVSCNSVQQLSKRIYKDKTPYARIQAARLLHKKEPFNERGIEGILDYYSEQKFDSANVFFENFTVKYPNRPEPYLLREKFGVYPDTGKFYGEHNIKDLKKALVIDTLNTVALKRLADLYYEDFIYPLGRDKYISDLMETYAFDSIEMIELKKRQDIKKVSRFPDGAKKALYYYDKAWKYNTNLHNCIYFPIKQLQCYLKKDSANQYPFPISSDYFPAGHFANLSNEWECDFTTNYLYTIERAQEFGNEWLSTQLKGLKEPVLFDKKINNHHKIYRFTWLRSFHNPIAIRIEKLGEEVYLYYKVGKGQGGYKPKGLKRKGKKKLPAAEWNNFEKLMANASYEGMKNNNDVMMMDGAEWVLEYKTSTLFQAKKTNVAGKNFTNACLYLVKLAKIKIPENDIY